MLQASACMALLAFGGRGKSAPPALPFEVPEELAPNGTPALPFRTLPERVPEDARRALIFFQYTCPFCRQHHAMLERWRSTLPAPMEGVWVPVVAAPDDLWMSRGYYSAYHADARRIEAFHHLMYAVAQGPEGVPRTKERYLAIALQAGYGERAYKRAWNHSETRRSMEWAAERMQQYDPVVTPSLGLLGQFLVSPEDVQGDYGLLLQLASGIVSQSLPVESSDRRREL